MLRPGKDAADEGLNGFKEVPGGQEDTRGASVSRSHAEN